MAESWRCSARVNPTCKRKIYMRRDETDSISCAVSRVEIIGLISRFKLQIPSPNRTSGTEATTGKPRGIWCD